MSAQSADGNNAVCVSGTWQYPAYTFQSAAASAEGSCSGTTAGTARYNTTLTRMEYCDGSVWKTLYKVDVTPAYTAPTRNGYFVMSYGTYNGNLGGLHGADAVCLSDLTTNTGWMGYTTANSNGQLRSGKVHAWLCQTSLYGCANLMPLTTYVFANGADLSIGGASFTTDSNGIGPNDSNDWAAANYFGGTYTYWTGSREVTDNSHWQNAVYSLSGLQACIQWTGGTSVNHGGIGKSAFTTSTRWQIAGSNNCDKTLHLICFVDP